MDSKTRKKIGYLRKKHNSDCITEQRYTTCCICWVQYYFSFLSDIPYNSSVVSELKQTQIKPHKQFRESAFVEYQRTVFLNFLGSTNQNRTNQSKLKKTKPNQTKPLHVLCQSTHAHSKTGFCKTPQKNSKLH